MSNSEWCPLDVLNVSGDPIARGALPIAGRESVAVPDVAEKLDVFTPAVYRRTEPLVEANPRNEHGRIGLDGNEHEKYGTKLDEVTFTAEDGSCAVGVRVDRNLTDDFESMGPDLELGSQRSELAGLECINDSDYCESFRHRPRDRGRSTR